MHTQDHLKHMPDFIQTAIEKQIQIASDEEFEKMKQRLEERKAEIVAGAVLYVQKMLDKFDLEEFRTELSDFEKQNQANLKTAIQLLSDLDWEQRSRL